MKKFPILLFSLIFISFSCKKTGTILISKDDVAGSWLLKKYSGGISYRVVIPTDSIAIIFEKSGKYTSSTNHVITAKGGFEIAKAADGYHYSDTEINLHADSGNQITYGIILKSDSLFLSEGCCDGFSYTYVKQE
jgi:hypothetical protein